MEWISIESKYTTIYRWHGIYIEFMTYRHCEGGHGSYISSVSLGGVS
jgi:hypothetical protein